MKQCSKCKGIFNLDQFHNSAKTKDGKTTWCKSCKHKANRIWKKTKNGRAYNTKRNRRCARAVKEWLLEELGAKKCLYCDENHPACLDFHHRNPEEKKFIIASNKCKKRTELLEEARKCNIVCANCHRKIHWT